MPIHKLGLFPVFSGTAIRLSPESVGSSQEETRGLGVSGGKWQHHSLFPGLPAPTPKPVGIPHSPKELEQEFEALTQASVFPSATRTCIFAVDFPGDIE